jgi:DNA-binding transcriptional LysR family regulator
LEVLTAEHLRGEKTIMLGHGSYIQHNIETAFESDRSQTLIETPLSAIACAMVREGLGITIVDPFSAASFEGMGVIIRRFEPVIDVGFALVMPEHRPISKLAQDFIDELQITGV